MDTAPSAGSNRPVLDVDLAVLQGRTDDEDAREQEWVRVFRHYHPRLESYFSRRVPTRTDLDTLLSDIWSRAVLHVGSLASARALWSWLTTIGNNVLRDRRRHDAGSGRREVLWTDTELDDGPRALLAGWTDASQTDEDARERAEALLIGLSADDREFLALYAVDGLSHEEIAARLSLPSAAASRQRLRRLRRRIAGDGAPE